MKYWIIVISCFFGLYGSASHVPGGNLTYECLGNDQYLVTLTIYEDEATGFIIAGGTETITITNDCGFVNPSLVLTNSQTAPNNVSQLCPTAGTGYPENNEWIYTGIVTLTDACDSWHLAYSNCCRDASTNLTGTTSDYYFASDLNNLDAICNTSPSFTAPPIPYICAGQTFCYNLGILEPDGDSLVFSFTTPLTAAGVSVPYDGGYGFNPPIAGMTIDSETGQVTGFVGTAGSYVIAILVEEFDDQGVLIGAVTQDFTVEVINCANQTLDCAASGTIGNITGSVAQTGPSTLEMCEGVPFSFSMSFEDPDLNDSLSIVSNIGSVLTGSTVSFVYPNAPDYSQVDMNVSWTPPPGSSGSNNLFTVTVSDNACPVSGQQTIVYNMNVLGSTNAGPDVTICLGDSVLLNVENGNVFDWTSFAGDPLIIGTNFSCTPCQNPFAWPNVTTTYVVNSDLVGSCESSDTITVNVVPDFNYSIDQSGTTSCLGGDIQLNVIASPVGNYSYTWDPPTDLSNTSIANPVITPSSPGVYNYHLIVTSNLGCVKHDDVSLIVAAAYAPDVTVTTNTNLINCGDTIFFDTDLGSGVPAACGLSSTNACTNPVMDVTVGNGTTSISNAPSPFYGFYEDNRIQMIYTAVELQALGFVGGKINQLGFEITNVASSQPYNGLTVKLGCTSLGSFTGSSFETGLSTVYNNASYTPSTGWNMLPLTTSYDWDGISNLIVEVCFDNGSYTSTDPVTQTVTAQQMAIYDYADGDIGCNLNVGTTSNNRPNIRFSFCATDPDPNDFTFVWTATAADNLNSTNIQNPFGMPNETLDYQLVVTNLMGGCTDTSLIHIDVNCDTCFAAIPTLTGTSCFGESDGQVLATPYGADGPPFIVSLLDQNNVLISQDNNVAVSTTFSSLSAGQYIIRTEDTTGCWRDTVIEIVEPQEMLINVSADTIVCINGTANLFASISGGNGGNIYNWIGTTNTNSNNIINPLVNTTNQVYAIDSKGCVSDTGSIDVSLFPPLVTNLINFDSICPHDGIVVSVAVNGGMGGPYNYNWVDSYDFSVGAVNPLSVTPVNPQTTYFVEVSDNCETSVVIDSVDIAWYPEPVPSFTTDISEGCYPVEVTFTSTAVSSVQCVWNFGNGETANTCSAVTANYLAPGQYDVNMIVMSDDGCLVDSIFSNVIEVFGYPTADFIYSPRPADVFDPEINFTDQSVGGNIAFEWSFGYYGPGQELGNSMFQNPTFIFPNDEGRLYPTQLIVTDTNGCMDTVVLNVEIENVFGCYIPTSFTPNDDGINDEFKVVGESISQDGFEFRIFDRWGSLVYHSADVNEGWDGRLANGVKAPLGAYVYVVKVENSLTLFKKEYRGTVTVAR